VLRDAAGRAGKREGIPPRLFYARAGCRSQRDLIVPENGATESAYSIHSAVGGNVHFLGTDFLTHQVTPNILQLCLGFPGRRWFRREEKTQSFHRKFLKRLGCGPHEHSIGGGSSGLGCCPNRRRLSPGSTTPSFVSRIASLVRGIGARHFRSRGSRRSFSTWLGIACPAANSGLLDATGAGVAG
jgi:hypothetical protein